MLLMGWQWFVLTIGAMFVWVFFENLGKGLYTAGGYAGLINYYIQHSHSPAAWKAVMGLMASHAAMAAPMQAMTEISLGMLLVVGLLTRPVAFVAFLVLGQSLGVGVGHGLDLGTTGSGAGIACARAGTSRTNVGRRRLAGAALAFLAVVVIEPRSGASVGRHSYAQRSAVHRPRPR